MSKLIDRWGRAGFAAVTSLIWALPMAAWAGSSDLSPIDKTAYPWVALSIGLVMFVVWIVLIARVARVSVSSRQRRFDLAQMSRAERRWTLITFAFALGAIAWLNAAATVDWGPLVAALTSGKIGPSLLALALTIFLLVMLAGIAASWRKANAAYRLRREEHARG